jgi:arylsulfatase A
MPPLIRSLVTMGMIFLCSLAAFSADQPPNVILILIDDMGFTDLSCYGSEFFVTPNIDRLAASGMRLTHSYSACTVCSPTRAAVMTGKYPARLHITDWIAGHNRPFAKLRIPDWRQYLPHDEITIAEAFKANDYTTCHIGKWHLGNEEHWPLTQGFDVNIGGNHRGQPPSYFFPYERDGIKLPGLSKGKADEYLTDRLTDEAITFISASKDKPFFLYFPHYTVHTPLQAKAEKIAKYQVKARPENPQHNATYAAMIESLDEGIGRLMDHLESLKLRDNTIIVFTSDNGGLKPQSTSNEPARAGKGSAYEGGVRVPYLVSYPKAIRAGSTSDFAAMSIDLFPTLLELCGLTPKPVKPAWDGVSIAPVLLGKGDVKREALYWHYPHYHPGGATPYGAVRSGNWRLVEFYETGKVELYNLKDDISETKDLAETQSQKRKELLTKLQNWRAEVGAQMPAPNPDYDPQRDAEQQQGKAKAKK